MVQSYRRFSSRLLSSPLFSGRLPSLAAVILVHVGIGYAFMSGLAYTVITYLPQSLTIEYITDDPPPPEVLPDPKVEPRTDPRPAPVDRVVDVPLPLPPTVPLDTSDTVPLPLPLPNVGNDAVPVPQPPSKATAAAAKSGRAGWITTEDYPAAAIRAEAQGIVAISVAIDANGRVADCTVTRSSGNAQLDEATCRLYTRRARFTPARDDAGNPVAGTAVDRISWRLPD